MWILLVSTYQGVSRGSPGKQGMMAGGSQLSSMAGGASIGRSPGSGTAGSSPLGTFGARGSAGEAAKRGRRESPSTPGPLVEAGGSSSLLSRTGATAAPSPGQTSSTSSPLGPRPSSLTAGVLGSPERELPLVSREMDLVARSSSQHAPTTETEVYLWTKKVQRAKHELQNIRDMARLMKKPVKQGISVTPDVWGEGGEVSSRAWCGISRLRGDPLEQRPSADDHAGAAVEERVVERGTSRDAAGKGATASMGLGVGGGGIYVWIRV